MFGELLFYLLWGLQLATINVYIYICVCVCVYYMYIKLYKTHIPAQKYTIQIHA